MNDDASAVIVARALRRFERWKRDTYVRTDRNFAKLLVAEWLFGIAVALVVSPYAWEGRARTIHAHVFLAVGLGGLIVALPIALAWSRPGQTLTRHVVAIGQILLSALLIHLTGGRIETHFQLFGSLAFIAFYLDYRVLITAAVTIFVDHFIRGLFYPESIYGITDPNWWLFLEHGFWVAFCVIFLARQCVSMLRSWLRFAEEGGMLEAVAESEWRAQSVLEREAREQASSREATE
jgi:hypothetical protein